MIGTRIGSYVLQRILVSYAEDLTLRKLKRLRHIRQAEDQRDISFNEERIAWLKRKSRQYGCSKSRPVGGFDDHRLGGT